MIAGCNRNIGSIEVSEPANRCDEVVNDHPVCHLLARHFIDQFVPSPDRLQLVVGKPFADALLEAECSVEVTTQQVVFQRCGSIAMLCSSIRRAISNAISHSLQDAISRTTGVYAVTGFWTPACAAYLLAENIARDVQLSIIAAAEGAKATGERPLARLEDAAINSGSPVDLSPPVVRRPTL
jgi:hypothetical protein